MEVNSNIACIHQTLLQLTGTDLHVFTGKLVGFSRYFIQHRFEVLCNTKMEEVSKPLYLKSLQ